MGMYFKGFEGHVEYSIKGSMCRFERKFLQLKPEELLLHCLQLHYLTLCNLAFKALMTHYSLKNELGWVLSPCFQSSRSTFLSSCLGSPERLSMFLPYLRGSTPHKQPC